MDSKISALPRGEGEEGEGKVELSVDNNAHYCDLIVSEALPYFECKKTT